MKVVAVRFAHAQQAFHLVNYLLGCTVQVINTHLDFPSLIIGQGIESLQFIDNVALIVLQHLKINVKFLTAIIAATSVQKVVKFLHFVVESYCVAPLYVISGSNM